MSSRKTSTLLGSEENREGSGSLPGLGAESRTWYLQLYHSGQRQRIKLGEDLDRQAAVVLAFGHRERMKQTDKVDRAESIQTHPLRDRAEL